MFLIIFNKYYLIYFYYKIFLGKGLYLKNNLNNKFFIFLIISNISLLILFKIIIPSLKITEISKRIFFYTQCLLFVCYISLKNLLFLNKIKKILKKNRKSNIFLPSIKFKLNIVIIQFIAFIIYTFLFILLKGFYLLKEECYNELEMDIFSEILDDYYIIFISIIYIPLFRPYKYYKFIKISKIKFPNFSKRNYRANISKMSLNNKKEINKFIKN